MDLRTLQATGFALVLVGVLIIIVVAILMYPFGGRRKDETHEATGEVRDGGAIVIGPIPIIFGTDKKSIKTILLLSMTLTVLLIIPAVIVCLTSR